jgi:hypothetical protein
LFVWSGHYQYKYTIATYIYNYLFTWKPFWVDVMRQNASVHGYVCYLDSHHVGLLFYFSRYV